jgi:hypothetical protein
MVEQERASGPSGQSPPQGVPDLRERRWALMRDVASFQVKMVVEGLRDILLVPLTLGAAAFGLLFGGQHPERLYRDVLRAGYRFDGWLNLFGTIGKRHPSLREGERGRAESDSEDPTIDQYFRAIETKLVEQHARGGVTRQAKEKVDRWLDTLHGVTSKKD